MSNSGKETLITYDPVNVAAYNEGILKVFSSS